LGEYKLFVFMMSTFPYGIYTDPNFCNRLKGKTLRRPPEYGYIIAENLSKTD